MSIPSEARLRAPVSRKPGEPAARACLAAAFVLAAGCTTTFSGAYWIPVTEGGSGGEMLNVKDDLGIDIPAAFYYEIIGEEAGQRARLGYWQAKGSGDMSSAPRDYIFDTLSVTAGDATRASVDVEVAEVFYEPAFIRTPDFRLRGIVGIDLVQFYMMIERTSAPQEMADVSIPGAGEGLLNLGIDYQLLLLLGGAIEYAFTPHIKILARMQLFDNSLLPSGDVEGAFLAGQIDLVFGAPEGRGPALVVGWRSVSAEYSDGTTESEAKLSGFLARVFLSF